MTGDLRPTSLISYCFGAHSGFTLTSRKAPFEGISLSILNITLRCGFFGL